MKLNFVILVGVVSCFGVSSWAGEQVGRLTQIEGTVEIYTNPSKSHTAKQNALFEGSYYNVNSGKAGDNVENGNIIRTTPGSKARVVFPNGDQYYVGPATSYRVSFKKDGDKDSQPEIHLTYGKIRGIVEKDGPRSRLQIRSRGVTMGVRGTDFYISSTQPTVEVTTLRGEVKVTKDSVEAPASGKKPPQPESVVIKTGQSVDVTTTIAAKKPTLGADSALETGTQVEQKAEAPQPERHMFARSTTQGELKEIDQVSKVKADPKKEIKEEIKKEVEKLESKAVEMTIRDIKKTDPTLAASLDESKLKSPDAVQTAVVNHLMKDAPKAPKNHKPFKSQIDPGQDPYDQYFKIEN